MQGTFTALNRVRELLKRIFTCICSTALYIPRQLRLLWEDLWYEARLRNGSLTPGLYSSIPTLGSCTWPQEISENFLRGNHTHSHGSDGREITYCGSTAWITSETKYAPYAESSHLGRGNRLQGRNARTSRSSKTSPKFRGRG